MMWTPLRAVKMYGRILGFHRLVWWPKWTPASNSWRRVTAGMPRLLVVVVCPPPDVIRAGDPYKQGTRHARRTGRVRWLESSRARTARPEPASEHEVAQILVAHQVPQPRGDIRSVDHYRLPVEVLGPEGDLLQHLLHEREQPARTEV